MDTKDHVRAGDDAGGTRLREPSVSIRLPDGTVSERPLRQVTAGQVVRAGPWRMTRSARGQAHYPGYYWSATSGGHVIYESRLELARLLLADFDPDVAAIAAQPFLLRALAGGRVRSHVPDFLLLHAGQTVEMVNVKPADRLADPAVAEALAWPGELFEGRGWGYEIWSGADPVVLANVRFLARLSPAGNASRRGDRRGPGGGPAGRSRGRAAGPAGGPLPAPAGQGRGTAAALAADLEHRPEPGRWMPAASWR